MLKFKLRKSIAAVIAAVMTVTLAVPTLSNVRADDTVITRDLTSFNIEGYAEAEDVTGGGVLAEDAVNYIQVSTAEEFLRAINKKDPSTNKAWAYDSYVIEVMNDIDLGYNLLSDSAKELSDVKAHATPKTHPVLKETGVSLVYIQDRTNLTIFSKNGATIKHAGITVKGTSNLVIRNLEFDELWEWDDSGSYDSNDWDYFTVTKNCNGVWIDHCTFNKAYDGVVDVKEGAQNVTASWCSFLDGDMTEDSFFDVMMDYLEENASSFSNYNAALKAGFTQEDIRTYASAQKKTHLLGAKSFDSANAALSVTLANNYYKNSMDRIPRLRGGNAHLYNCVIDSSDIWNLKLSLQERNIAVPSKLKIVSNGAISTESGTILMENCNINGMNVPVRNNNTDPADDTYTGYIAALNTRYTITDSHRSADGTDYETEFSGTYLGNSTDEGSPLAPFPCDDKEFDVTAFKASLGYSYTLYDADTLSSSVLPYTGAGVLPLSSTQWMKVSYSEKEEVSEEYTEIPTTTEESSSEADSTTEAVTTETVTEESAASSKIVFNANDYEAQVLTSSADFGAFTVTATEKKNVTIDSSTKSIDGFTFTQRLKLGGGGCTDYRSVKFSASDNAKVTVYAMSSSTTDDRQLLLTDENGTELSSQPALYSALTKLTYTIDTKGTYYLMSASNGINIYYICVEGASQSEEESSVEEVTTEGSSSEETEETTEGETDPVPDTPVISGSHGTITTLGTLKDSEIKNKVYASPSGNADAKGTKADPMDLLTAINTIEPGTVIILSDGTYSFDSQLTIPYGNNGTADLYKYIKAADDATNVTLDFSSEPYNSSEPSKNDRGLQIEGNYWHIYGITVYGSADNGIFVAGNNNIVENCILEANRDTGLQISRRNSSLSSMSDWPANNLILNCTSFNNMDTATGENADGFAAKLTCGEGNIFDGCIAYNNVDDGWDLYTKSATGAIGSVTIKNCIAFRNGATSDGAFTENSDGNGFKLGGDSIGVDHYIYNCISFENKNHGFTDNSNPGVITIANCTSYNNSLENGKKSNFDFARSESSYNIFENLISFSTSSVSSDKYIGSATNCSFYNSKKYYLITETSLVNTKSGYKGELNSAGVSSSDFMSLTAPALKADIHSLFRNSDGTVNTNGFLETSENGSYVSMGAHFGTKAEEIIECLGITGAEEESTEKVTEEPSEEITEEPSEEIIEEPSEEITEEPSEEITEESNEETSSEETEPAESIIDALIDAIKKIIIIIKDLFKRF